MIKHQSEMLSLRDDKKTLRIRDTLVDGVSVEHTIAARADEVDFHLVANNLTSVRSEAHWAQPCVRLANFTGFDEKDKTNIDDYLPKCFFFIDNKLTRMSDIQPWAKVARYTPGQVWCPVDVPRTDVNPRPLSSIVPSIAHKSCLAAFVGCDSSTLKRSLATKPFSIGNRSIVAE